MDTLSDGRVVHRKIRDDDKIHYHDGRYTYARTWGVSGRKKGTGCGWYAETHRATTTVEKVTCRECLDFMWDRTMKMFERIAAQKAEIYEQDNRDRGNQED